MKQFHVNRPPSPVVSDFGAPGTPDIKEQSELNFNPSFSSLSMKQFLTTSASTTIVSQWFACTTNPRAKAPRLFPRLSRPSRVPVILPGRPQRIRVVLNRRSPRIRVVLCRRLSRVRIVQGAVHCLIEMKQDCCAWRTSRMPRSTTGSARQAFC